MSDRKTGQAPYVHAREPIGNARDIYDGALMPDLQVNTFRNIDRLFATRTVHRGDFVYPLPKSASPVTSLTFHSQGREYDLYDYVSLNRISGLLALKDGEVVYETYQLGCNENSRWMSMSIAKTISAMLVGAAVHDGYIRSVNDLITEYAVTLAGSAYEGVTIRQLLQMTSGVRWNETYTDTASDRRRLLDAQIVQQPGEMLAVIKNLDRAAPPGTRWNYSTGETQVVAELVRAATGRWLADYLSEKIWARFGMEQEATWWLEAPDGLEVGGSGLSATLRDYARFGLFMLHDGIAGKQRVLPESWLADASAPADIGGESVAYGYMLWPVPDAIGTIHDGAFEAHGIFGQQIYVNPRENMVIVVWSARSKPQDSTPVTDLDFFAALCESVR